MTRKKVFVPFHRWSVRTSSKDPRRVKKAPRTEEYYSHSTCSDKEASKPYDKEYFWIGEADDPGSSKGTQESEDWSLLC